eukprot:jgi/Ulvmu1/10802/UM069_0038.1
MALPGAEWGVAQPHTPVCYTVMDLGLSSAEATHQARVQLDSSRSSEFWNTAELGSASQSVHNCDYAAIKLLQGAIIPLRCCLVHQHVTLPVSSALLTQL